MRYHPERPCIDGIPTGFNGRVITPGSRALVETIRARMAALRLTNGDLCDRLRCSPSNVAAVMNGRTNFPSRHVLAWAQALELDDSEREAFLLAASLATLDGPAFRYVETLRAQAG